MAFRRRPWPGLWGIAEDMDQISTLRLRRVRWLVIADLGLGWSKVISPPT